ncbi:MAG: hypothetical protein ACYS0G_08875 [Planctomycetota bacterium]|jgi:hypothetical protein
MARGLRWPTATIDSPSCLLPLAACLLLLGCERYRVEYHHRPAYYRNAAVGELPDRVTLDDGTVLVFGPRSITSGLKPDGTGEPVRIRAEQDDGTIVLRAFLPEDVMANTLTCLRNQEYELLWEQMVARRTKEAYHGRGQGVQEFAAFCERNRRELAATLTRMLLGLPRQEAIMENVDAGVVRCRFYPQVADQFRFKTVEVVSEPEGLRLLMIR